MGQMPTLKGRSYISILAVLSRDFPDIYSIGSKLEVAIQFKNTVTTQISSQSDNWKLRYSILEHIFGPSSGTLGPIPKKILWTIYLLWQGIGPNISLLGPILWKELRCKGIKWHFGPHFWPYLWDPWTNSKKIS